MSLKIPDMWSITILLFFLEVLIHVNSQACRVCDQLISGRNLPYGRALTIIQDEEYLDESDFDEIRYKRRYDSQLYNEGKMFHFFPLIAIPNYINSVGFIPFFVNKVIKTPKYYVKLFVYFFTE